MPLFDVPGWIVDLPPVPETSSTTSKKRKRPANDSCKVEAAEANLEKLVKKLKLPLSTDTSPNTRKGKNKANDDHPVSAKPKKRKHKKPEEVTEQGKQNLAPKLSGSAPVEKSQRGDKKHGSGTSPSNAATSGLTALQKGMKESLDGARFRMINESLYKSDSHHAHQMMKEDPHVFEDYHSGFRHQVQLWPTNPVDHYISVLTTYPKKTIIADLGCGDAAMAHALIPKGLNVLSFDLVSEGTFVVEADICSKIPLPGSAPSLDDKSEGQGHVVDVVLRQSTTGPKEFREGVHQISMILGIESTRTLEESTFEGRTPVGPFTGTFIKPLIGLTPILRAGLGMTDALLTLFPNAPVYHLGLFREKVTLQPVEYYSKLPPSPPVNKVFLLDPLIATGGTAIAALAMIVEWGIPGKIRATFWLRHAFNTSIPVKDIKLLCVLASQQGLQHIQDEYPDLEIWAAGVDQELTPEGYINPGLGDTGDRLFSTIRA
ncbi:hypothetical protein H0H92_004812 [Tricholoma furcatifolium]|nr:hypothetical protein H0H92_004812 [Tricholoma furcatifolium]